MAAFVIGSGSVHGLAARERKRGSASARPRRSAPVVSAKSDDELERMRAELERLRAENLKLKDTGGEELAAEEEEPPRMFGKHGERSRFVPAVKLDRGEFAPRVVPVVGRLAELDADVVRSAPHDTKRFKVGVVASTSGGPLPKSVVTLPGSFQVAALSKPVAIWAPVPLPEGAEEGADVPDESLLIVERDQALFDEGGSSVALWETADGVRLGWLQSSADAAKVRCLGEVAIAYSAAWMQRLDREEQGVPLPN